MYHVPVLQHEVGQLLSSVRSPKLLIDATLGDGGHALLMHRVHPSAHIIGIDRDGTMLHRATKRLATINGVGRRIAYVHGWFDEILATLCGTKRVLRHGGQVQRHNGQVQRHGAPVQQNRRQVLEHGGQLRWLHDGRLRGLHNGHNQRNQHSEHGEHTDGGGMWWFSSDSNNGQHSERSDDGTIGHLSNGSRHRKHNEQLQKPGYRQLDRRQRYLYKHAARCVRKAQTRGADFILFDLGISTVHYALRNMGFSFTEDCPLDMRLDTSAQLTAAHIVNRASVSMLEQLLWHYGNERHYRSIAQHIYQAARHRPITTTGQLVSVVQRAYPKHHTQQRTKKHSAARRHIATKTFMALRIAVNDEFGRLMRALPLAFRRLRRGGLLACITFHSAEDRIVKQCFQFMCGRHGVQTDGQTGGVLDGRIGGVQTDGRIGGATDGRIGAMHDALLGDTIAQRSGAVAGGVGGSRSVDGNRGGEHARHGGDGVGVGVDVGAGVDGRHATRGGTGSTYNRSAYGRAAGGGASRNAHHGSGYATHGTDNNNTSSAAHATRACAQLLTKKPIVPSRDEIIHNRAARSAKLRAIQKLEDMATEWLPTHSYGTIDLQSLC